MDVVMLFLFLLFIIWVFIVFRGKKHSGQLPPGPLGLPWIGQSFEFLNALKNDDVHRWFQERIARYGPISKATLFGYPTVIVHGTAANKFVFAGNRGLLVNKQPPSAGRIIGENNILELYGNDHARVRGALVSFLRIEVLKQYVPKVDEEIRNHIQTYWHGKTELQVQRLMKTLTFDVICSILIGVERGPKRQRLLPVFREMMECVLSIAINLPFTRFRRGLNARKKLIPLLLEILREKRQAYEEEKLQGTANPHKDLFTLMLSLHDEDAMSDEEVIDNIIVVMLAGYDTTSILLTFIVRLLANRESKIYMNMIREHEEVAKSKLIGETLTWDDLSKMKYTWRVASEVLRVNAPVVTTFRRAIDDIEYEGYLIPKGWQVALSATMTHFDERIFENPNTFDPDRFDKDSKPPAPPYSFLAFSAGPRMCPGMELARMETLTMIHHLITNFTWDVVNSDESFVRIPMPEFKHGMSVKITPKT